MPGPALIEPLSPDSPCGEDLEDTQLLASFDAFRLFGQSVPLASETDWRAIRDHSNEALAKSKDLRILAHLGSAVVRTDGWAPFAGVLEAGSTWLDTWWQQVFPRVDDDAVLRRNALNAFADRMAVVDGVRRTPLLAHRQLGSLSVRDMEIAAGKLPKPEGEAQQPDAAYVNAMLSASSLEELEPLRGLLDGCLRSLKSMETAMTEHGGSEAAPDFGLLAAPLAHARDTLAAHIKSRAPAEASGTAAGAEGADGDEGQGPRGPIRSRDDAVRALDAVATFFRASEPSSPVPLFIERAKRLIAKDFLSVLQDIAPDALAQAKAVGGVRDQD